MCFKIWCNHWLHWTLAWYQFECPWPGFRTMHHMMQKDSSAINFDRVEKQLFLFLFYLWYLVKTFTDMLQEMLHTNTWKFQAVSVSAEDGIVVLGKAHMRSTPSLSSLPKVTLETVPIFGWTQIVLDLGGWNVGHFLSPLLFPSGPERDSNLLLSTGGALQHQAVYCVLSNAVPIEIVKVDLPAVLRMPGIVGNSPAAEPSQSLHLRGCSCIPRLCPAVHL